MHIFHKLIITALLFTLVALGNAAAHAQSSAVPYLNQPSLPASIAPDSTDVMLTVNGAGFAAGAAINWNGAPLVTKQLSPTQLSATVPASSIAASQTASMTAVNQSHAASNTLLLPVSTPILSIAFARSDLPTPLGPVNGLVAADFNGDGKIDLATSSNPTGLSVWLGNGDGTFQPRIDYDVGAAGRQVGPLLAADFDGDGKVDLLYGYGNLPLAIGVSVGNGDGTFQPPIVTQLSIQPVGLAAGDFNRDGKLDLAVATYAGDSVVVLLGVGDGTFQVGQTYGVPGLAGSVAVGDFNRDGVLDVAATFDSGLRGVIILQGVGDGTFVPGATYGSGGDPTSIAVGDLNGDGIADLAVSVTHGGGLSVLIGKGDGTFQPRVTYTTGTTTDWVSIADMNSDGVPDLATVDSVSSSAKILLGNGDGTFQKALSYATTLDVTSGLIADFNGDGRLDIVALGTPTHDLAIMTQTQGPTVSLTPTSISFPTQAVKRAGPAQVATLTNTGVAPLTISSITLNDPDFTFTSTCPLTPATLAAGAKCTLRASSEPQSKGPHTGTITITDDAPGSPQTISLSGTGTLLLVAPSSVGFGSVTVGTSVQQTVALTNLATTSIKILSVSALGQPFSLTNPCGATLAFGATCNLTVQFTPQSTGTFTSTFSIAENASGSPLTVNVTGTGQFKSQP